MRFPTGTGRGKELWTQHRFMADVNMIGMWIHLNEISFSLVMVPSALLWFWSCWFFLYSLELLHWYRDYCNSGYINSRLNVSKPLCLPKFLQCKKIACPTSNILHFHDPDYKWFTGQLCKTLLAWLVVLLAVRWWNIWNHVLVCP